MITYPVGELLVTCEDGASWCDPRLDNDWFIRGFNETRQLRDDCDDVDDDDCYQRCRDGATLPHLV